MHDVAMRRMLAALVLAAAVALLVVGGAMLFGMGNPAQAQSDPEPPCTENFCLDKTANPSTATVGQPITFTITQRCPEDPVCVSSQDIVDTLPSGLSIVSVDDSQPDYQCSTSENTVTCPGGRSTTPTAPFTLTIVATPTECGSFTNTANTLVDTAQVTFTVEGCVPPNRAPTVRVAPGGKCGPASNMRGTINLALDDPDDAPQDLTLTATSSNRDVVPNGSISFGGGTDASRTMTVTRLTGTGASTLTVTASDGEADGTVKVRVLSGSASDDALSGSALSDMIFAKKGSDAASGRGSKDLLCGGNGRDELTGGLLADHFGGGAGTDTATDFDASQGDTKAGIP